MHPAYKEFRATRTLGSILGFRLVYGWEWYFWREAHEYFMSPFAIFLWVISLIYDCVYPYAMWRIEKRERVLGDGRKLPGNKMNRHEERKLQ